MGDEDEENEGQTTFRRAGRLMATGLEVGRTGRSSPVRIVAILAVGLVLGGLLAELAVLVLPRSAAREFFVTTVAATFGPLTVDLRVLAATVGPLVLRLNVLSVLGVLLVAWFARSLL